MTRSSSALALLLSGLFVMGCGPSGGGGGGGISSSPGAAAPTLVRSPHATLRVEVDHAEGRRPSDEALELLRQRLAERTDHPGGVEVVIDDVFAPTGREVHTVDDLRALAARHAPPPPSSDLVVIHVLYVDGAADRTLGDQLLGAAWAERSIAVFPDTIDGAVGGSTVRRTLVERWTLLHEAGHVLGLVGLGAPQVVPHEVEHKPHHCSTPACVMGWSADELATDFCPRCVDDLRAIGGR